MIGEFSELKPLEERERHVIEAGTEIFGGKLLTRAAFVVDTVENPEVYDAVLDAIDGHTAVLGRMGAPLRTFDRLKATFGVVSGVLPRNEPRYAEMLKAEALSRGLERLTNEHELGLSRFIGVSGMCHQHSLLSATMLRLMQERGDFGGTVSLESRTSHGNLELSPDHPKRHTKAVFIEDGTRYSLDTDTGLTMRRQATAPA